MFRFLLKLYRLTRPRKSRLALGVLFGLLAGVADPAMLGVVVVGLALVFPSGKTPAIAQAILDDLRKKPWLNHALEQVQTYIAHHHSFAVLACVVAAIPALMLARGVVLYLYSYLMSWVMVRAIADLRTRAFEHLVNLPLSFFGANSTGELMSRVGDIGILQNVVGSSIMVFIKEPVTVATLAFALIVTQWKLTLFAAIFAPLFIIPISIYSKKGRKSAGAAQTNTAGLARLMHESFTSNRIIKVYNIGPVVSRQFRAETGQLINHSMRVVRSTETPGPLIEFMASVGAAALLLYFAVQPNASAGDFATFVIIIFMMYRPIKSLVRLHSQLEQARAATERIFSLLATHSSLPEPAQPLPLHAANAQIHFDAVTFTYGAAPVLQDIQWCVQPGQMAALVGLSGSGKTTLTNLLLRFYDPTAGAVRIGGL